MPGTKRYLSFKTMTKQTKKNNPYVQLNYRYFCGITPECGPNKDITILRSIVDTYYYNDNLKDYKNVIYTLYGPIGDQSEDIYPNNKFLDKNISKHIYLYQKNPSSGEYRWFGKYEVLPDSKQILDHPGENGKMRKIINYTLKYISRY